MPEETLSTNPTPIPVTPEPISTPQPTPPGPRSGFNIILILIIVVLLLVVAGGGVYLFMGLKDKEKKETGSVQNSSGSNTSTTQNNDSNQNQGTKTSPKSDVVFDVPFFLGKSRSEVKAALGKPTTEYTDPQYGNSGYLRYTKNNYTLQVEYPPTFDGKPTTFGYIIVGIDYPPAKSTILKDLNLEETSSNYKMGIKRLDSKIDSIYIFPNGSEYYNKADYSAE